jgi:hypothetical protein
MGAAGVKKAVFITEKITMYVPVKTRIRCL